MELTPKGNDCRYSENRRIRHRWSAIDDDTPMEIIYPPEIKPIPLPYDGIATVGRNTLIKFITLKSKV